MVNPRIKYAFVMQNPVVQSQIEEAVAKAVMLHETRTFETWDQAARWLGLSSS
jgi:phage baseplate assembly protein W